MKRLAVLAALLLLASLAYGQPGKGYRDDRGYSGRGYVVGRGVVTPFVDVDLDSLGQDLIAGEYWTPSVDFSAGTKYYFDPAATVSGDGSIDSPFRGLGWEIYNDRVIENWNRLGTLTNGGTAVVGSGDVCVLLSGNHGKIQFYERFFTGYLGIVGAPSESAKFDYIGIKEGAGFYFENLDPNPNMRTGGFWDAAAIGDTTVIGYDSGPYFVEVRIDSSGNYPDTTERIVFNDMDFILASAATSDGWSAYEWNQNFVGGILTSRADYAHVQGCTFESLGNGVRLNGSDSGKVSYGNIIGNYIKNFCGGAWNTSSSEFGDISDNESYDMYLVNKNHIDHIQAFGMVHGVSSSVYRRNRMFNSTSPTRDLYAYEGYITQRDAEPEFGALKGYVSGAIGFTTENMMTDLLVENNIAFIQSYNDSTEWGIKAYKDAGGTNIRYLNNTGVSRVWDGSDDLAVAWIKIGSDDGTYPCVDCVVENNIIGGISVRGSDGSEAISNNSSYTRDFTNAGFTSWSAMGDPSTFDFTLAAGSENIDAGVQQFAPNTDYLGDCRPVGTSWDIGAYEYGETCATLNNELAASWYIDDSTSCWTASATNFAVTHGQFGPYGNDADLVELLTTTTARSIYSEPSYTISASTIVASTVWKNDDTTTANRMQMYVYNDTAGTPHRLKVLWNASDVLGVSATAGLDDYGIYDLGGGWYRMWFMVDLATRGEQGDSFRVWLDMAAGTPTIGDGTFIAGTQLEYDVIVPGHYLKVDCP